MKKRRKPSPITVKPTASELALGIGRCIDNADEYRIEAVLLLKASHKRRALALAILGLEEISKVEQLGSLALHLEKEEFSLDEFWYEFTHHGKKQALALHTVLKVAYQELGESGIGELMPVTVTENKPSTARLDLETLKQQCLYVGYDSGNRCFAINKPTAENAESLIKVLKSALRHYRHLTDFKKCKSILERLIKDGLSDEDRVRFAALHKSFVEALNKQVDKIKSKDQAK